VTHFYDGSAGLGRVRRDRFVIFIDAAVHMSERFVWPADLQCSRPRRPCSRMGWPARPGAADLAAPPPLHRTLIGCRIQNASKTSAPRAVRGGALSDRDGKTTQRMRRRPTTELRFIQVKEGVPGRYPEVGPTIHAAGHSRPR